VTIEWTTEGVGSISYLGTSTDFNIIEGSLNVTVAPVAQIPDTPDTISYNFTDDNYIFTITPQIAVENINEITSNDEAIKNITYFDEIGRPKQKIAIGYSPNSFDIINHYEYDNFGRTAKEFLPIPINELSGELVENVELLGGNYYLEEYNEQVWYSNKKYSDPSFNIVEEQAFPGNDWSIESEHTAKNFVTSNAANEVLKFKVKFWSNGDPYFEKDGYYEANSLIKSVIKDENWKLEDGTKNTTEQFEDKLGRIVLTRTYTTSDIGNSTNIFTPHDTYYIYDDLGRLTYVLPPKVNAVSGFTTEEFYEYKYDERSRLVEKRIPGKETEYIIYNKIDQVVLTQDGNLRANNRWIFNKYDALGRVTYSGIYSDGNSREGMQEMAYNETDNLYERRLYSPINIDGVSAYYSNDAFPFEGQTLAITNINYYDSYVDIDGGIRTVSVY
jgi:hypothetical protein